MLVGHEHAPAVPGPNGTPGIRWRGSAVRSAPCASRPAPTRLADGSAPSPSPERTGRQAGMPSQRRGLGRQKGAAVFLGGARRGPSRRRRSRPAAGTSIRVWCRTAAAPATRGPTSRSGGQQASGARGVGRKMPHLFAQGVVHLLTAGGLIRVSRFLRSHRGA
jgi:hypothetical protein